VSAAAISITCSDAGNYFKKDYQDHTGRPDMIVLEIISNGGDHEYLIVEVKNSANGDTIRREIKETPEYLAFLRLNEEYVFGRDDEEYFGYGWNGLLVVQDLKRETASLEEQADSEIKILQAAELENQLAQVLKRKL
jgi:hypothetical protein